MLDAAASKCNEAQNLTLKRNGNRQVTAKGIEPQFEQFPNEIPADLAALTAIWPKIPEHIRAAIMALVGTVKS